MAARLDWRHVASTALGVLAGAVATAGTAAVAVAGFTLSYDAIRKVGIAAGVRPDWAWLLPVSIDGAMAVGTVTAVVMSRMGRKVWYPWMVVLAGAGISIACNALHAQMRELIKLDDNTAMAVSAIPAVMLALSVHLLVVLTDAAAKMLDRQVDPVPTVLSPSEDVAPAEVSHPTDVVAETPVSDRDQVPAEVETVAGDIPAPATPAATDTPAPRQVKPRASAPRRDNSASDIAKQDARRRVRSGESCAVVATDLKVSKKTVERWTQDIRETRQRATGTTAADGDDTKERRTVAVS